jgi:hypothetical protein
VGGGLALRHSPHDFVGDGDALLRRLALGGALLSAVLSLLRPCLAYVQRLHKIRHSQLRAPLDEAGALACLIAQRLRQLALLARQNSALLLQARNLPLALINAARLLHHVENHVGVVEGLGVGGVIVGCGSVIGGRGLGAGIFGAGGARGHARGTASAAKVA